MNNENNMRALAWDCYFSGVTSISRHPGAGKDIGFGQDHERTIEECAEIADQMLIERDKRFGVES